MTIYDASNPGEMQNVIECTDVFGRQIILPTLIWENHVLSSREWMKGWAGIIRKTLEEPTLVNIDRQFGNRECFYAKGTPYNPQRLFKVVVEFDPESVGTVVTAYPSRNIPKGERPKWP